MAVQNFSWVIPDRLAGAAIPGAMSGAPPKRIQSDLEEFYARGIRCLISLQRMPDSFGKLCKKSGLIWIHFPIDDFEAPDNTEEFSCLVNRAVSLMGEGKPVCVHCRAGVGRTGLLLACIVGKYFGIDGEKAIEAVRKNRTALDTNAQTRFVQRFCRLGQ